MANSRPKLLFLCMAAVVLSECNNQCYSLMSDPSYSSWLDQDDDVDMLQTRPDTKETTTCDMSTGKWVFDESYPLYDSDCPYLSTAVTCQRNGRPDSDYEKWRWKPTSCSLPR